MIPDKNSTVSFPHLMNAVRTANLNGFACGLGWALTHPEQFYRLLESEDLGPVEQMAEAYADHAADRVVVTMMTGDADGRPECEFIRQLGDDL